MPLPIRIGFRSRSGTTISLPQHHPAASTRGSPRVGRRRRKPTNLLTTLTPSSDHTVPERTFARVLTLLSAIALTTPEHEQLLLVRRECVRNHLLPTPTVVLCGRCRERHRGRRQRRGHRHWQRSEG